MPYPTVGATVIITHTQASSEQRRHKVSFTLAPTTEGGRQRSGAEVVEDLAFWLDQGSMKLKVVFSGEQESRAFLG